MAYIKTVWHNGDVVTAARMNHIEGGIESAFNDRCFLIVADVSSSHDGATLNKTWQEIHDAFASGKRCLVKCEGEYCSHLSSGIWFVVNSVYVYKQAGSDDTYGLSVAHAWVSFSTEDKDGHPEHSDN